MMRSMTIVEPIAPTAKKRGYIYINHFLNKISNIRAYLRLFSENLSNDYVAAYRTAVPHNTHYTTLDNPTLYFQPSHNPISILLVPYRAFNTVDAVLFIETD